MARGKKKADPLAEFRVMLVGNGGNSTALRRELKKINRPDIAIVCQNTEKDSKSIVSLLAFEKIPAVSMYLGPENKSLAQFRGYWLLKNLRPSLVVAVKAGDKDSKYILTQAKKLKIECREVLE